eukprot:352478-Chlamydomonas_euryale.AAC.13
MSDPFCSSQPCAAQAIAKKLNEMRATRRWVDFIALKTLCVQYDNKCSRLALWTCPSARLA